MSYNGQEMEGKAELDREELFLKELLEIRYTYLLWNEETLLLYNKYIKFQDPTIWSPERRKNYKALEGIDLGVGGIVKHFSYSSLAKFIDIKQDNSQVARFMYGDYYKGRVDYYGVDKIVTIKNWKLGFPLRNCFPLYPAMLYNAIVLTRPDQSKRRPNVAKLIGYSIDKILVAVYDIHPSCTLYQAIFETSDFDWKYRVRAAIGVGRAIESFHEDGIVVGCIDAEWMLLDQEFNVQLCHFSLQPHLKAMFPTELISLLPFPYEGYGRHAPEGDRYQIHGWYDPKREKDYVTLERDIYSYGVLLLMLISKQKFNEICFHEWIEDLSQEEASNLVHESFLEVEEDEAKKITSLAASCLSVDPLKRPKIKDVVMSFESLTRDHLGHSDKILKV